MISELLKDLKLVIEFFKALILSLKKKSEDIIIPEDNETFKKIIPYLEELKKLPELQKIPEFNSLFERYDIIEIEGAYGFIDKKISKEIAYKLYKSKKEELKQRINVIPVDDSINFKELEEPKYIEKSEKSIYDVLPHLSLDIRSLINISLYIESLYKQKRIKEAENMKRSIKQRYDEPGQKFCNCYQRGYIKKLIFSLKEKPSEIEREIHNFLKRPIFFVHMYMSGDDIEEIRSGIKNALLGGEEYIAIHSLGAATPLAKSIVIEMTYPEGLQYEIVEIDKKSTKEKVGDFSKIWYKNEGERIYSLIKDIIV